MDYSVKLKGFLEKLRNLPEQKKKIILIVIIAALALIIGFFEVRSTMHNISSIQESAKNIRLPQLNIPDMQSNEGGSFEIESTE